MSLTTWLIDYILPPMEEPEVEPVTEPEPEIKETEPEEPESGLSITMFEPRSFEEAGEIIEFIRRDNHAAFVSLNRMNKNDAVRLSDRLGGACEALAGDACALGDNVLYCASSTHPLIKRSS